jgi:AcrR family transcriptional regulator
MRKKIIILHAALRLFSEKGYKDTSMAELAQKTGVAQGTIFYHYISKEGLFISILKEFKEALVEEHDRYFMEQHNCNGLDMIEEVIAFYLYLAGKMEDQFLLLHRHYAYELAKINPECRNYLEGIYNYLVDIFEIAINKGQDDGSIASLHGRKYALLIFTMVDGVVRLNTYNLYHADSIYPDLVTACQKILKNINLK